VVGTVPLDGGKRLVHQRRRWVIAGALIFVAFAAVWGTQVLGALKGGGFDDPGSGSSHAAKIINDRVGPPDGELVVLYESRSMTVDDPAFRAAVTGTLARLPKNDVPHVTTFWDTRSPALVSRDRHATYAAIRLTGADLQARLATYDRIRDDLAAPGLRTLRGGTIGINSDLNRQTSAGLARAEMISTPILLALLVVIFGSLVSALLPLLIGGVAILGAFTALRLLTLTTDVSTFAINVVTMLGLGLAIDYALFIVTRYREELRRTDSEREALVRTMATAGRTVAFSGITVAIALGGLLFFPQMFLRSMGLGGMAVVLVDMLAALTVLPAVSCAGPWPMPSARSWSCSRSARRSWASGSAASTYGRCRPAPRHGPSRPLSTATSPTARSHRSTSSSPAASRRPTCRATPAACAGCPGCPRSTSWERAATRPTSRCVRRPTRSHPAPATW
jgi:RND superfamily putative drug exporter